MPFDERNMKNYGKLASSDNLAVTDCDTVDHDIGVFSLSENRFSWAGAVSKCIINGVFFPGLYAKNGFRLLHTGTDQVDLVVYSQAEKTKRTTQLSVDALMAYTVPNGCQAVATFRGTRKEVQFSRSIFDAFDSSYTAEKRFAVLYVLYHGFLGWLLEGTCNKIKFTFNACASALLENGNASPYLDYAKISAEFNAHIPDVSALCKYLGIAKFLRSDPEIVRLKSDIDIGAPARFVDYQWRNLVLSCEQGWLKVSATEDLRVLAYMQMLNHGCKFSMEDGSTIVTRATGDMRIEAEHIEDKTTHDC